MRPAGIDISSMFLLEHPLSGRLVTLGELRAIQRRGREWVEAQEKVQTSAEGQAPDQDFERPLSQR